MQHFAEVGQRSHQTAEDEDLNSTAWRKPYDGDEEASLTRLWDPMRPSYHRSNLQWGVRGENPNIVFEVDGGAFTLSFPVTKYRDVKHIERVAREHWAALEQVARDAIAESAVKAKKYKGMDEVTYYVIEHATFRRLASNRGFGEAPNDDW